MKFHEKNKYRGSVLCGALVMVAGALLLLANFNVIELQAYWRYWPMIIVALAFSKLIFPESQKEFAEGVWLLTLGGWLQVSILGVFGLTFGNSWPILLVGFGIHMLLKPPKHPRANRSMEVRNAS